MYYNKVEICGIDTSKLKVLSEKEKTELMEKAKKGDKKAREDLINGNLRLVLSVIQRFAGRGESLDDLFQVGCIGLIKSIDNFDSSKMVRLSTYAVPMTIECREKKGQQNDKENRTDKSHCYSLGRGEQHRDLRKAHGAILRASADALE